MTAKLSNTFPCYVLTAVKAVLPRMLSCEKNEEGVPAWILFTPKPRLRTSCWVRAHRHWHWGEVTSAASSNAGWAAPEPHQIKVTPPFFGELSEPREGSGGCSREGGCRAGQSLLPALVCQGLPWGMLPCLFCRECVGPAALPLTSGHDSAL